MRIAILAVCFSTLISIVPASSQELGRMMGQWNHDVSGDNIEVRRNWDVFHSDKGQGRITTATQSGANVQISWPNNLNCYYYVSFTNQAQRMNWQLREGDRALCPRGLFNRVSEQGSADQPPNQGGAVGSLARLQICATSTWNGGIFATWVPEAQDLSSGWHPLEQCQTLSLPRTVQYVNAIMLTGTRNGYFFSYNWPLPRVMGNICARGLFNFPSDGSLRVEEVIDFDSQSRPCPQNALLNQAWYKLPVPTRSGPFSIGWVD